MTTTKREGQAAPSFDVIDEPDAHLDVSGRRVGLSASIDDYLSMQTTISRTLKGFESLHHNDGRLLEQIEGLPTSGWCYPMYENALDVTTYIKLAAEKYPDRITDVSSDTFTSQYLGYSILQAQTGLNAGLTYVNDDIIHLMSIASEALDDTEMFPTDLIAKSGFVFLQTPLVTHLDVEMNLRSRPDIGPLSFSIERAIRGFVWSYDNNSLTFIPFMDNTFDADAFSIETFETFKRNGGRLTTDDIESLESNRYGRLGVVDKKWHTGKYIPCALSINNKDDRGAFKANTPFLKFFLCLMRFCWQELTSTRKVGREDVDRGSWRRIERGGIEANIVYIRRKKAKGKDAESVNPGSLEYRSLTRGHWKNVYCSSLGPVGDPKAYRTQWINEYLRGPEGAPIRRSPKVTAVIR